MKHVVLGVIMSAVALPVCAGWSNCYADVSFVAHLSKAVAITRCTWESGGIRDNSIYLRGQMTVTPSNVKTFCNSAGYCGMSIYPDYVASTSYTATATIKATSPFDIPLDEITLSDTKISPDPINPHSTCVDFSCTPGSPIIISLRGDYHLTSMNDGVMFDIDADGVEERTSWTVGGSDLGFLALDRNGNGRIDHGAELFGDANAENGWVALAALDQNGDEVIDEGDAAWSALLLWYDVNHDGRSDAGELVKVTSTEIRAVSTRYRWTGRKDPFGNTFRYAGDVMLTHGRREAYDVYFLTRR